MFKENNHSFSSFKGILAAYLVLILHILLVAIIGMLVLFFSGVMKYITLVFLCSVLIILILCVYVYKKIKINIETFTKFNFESRLYNQPMEINFFGGLASLRLGPSMLRINNLTDNNKSLSKFRLYDNSKIQEMAELANLLEKKLITIAEYNEAKKDIFHP